MKTIKKVIALSMALAACQAAPADTPKEKIVLGTSADFAPYEFHKIVDGKDTIMGADIQLAKKIAADLGKELEIVDMDFNLLLTQLKEGKVDMVIASMNSRPDRLEQADFSNPYYVSEHVLLMKEVDSAKYPSVASANKAGVIIAAQSGSVQETQLKEYFPDAEHIILKKVPDEVSQLKSGKVDGVILEADVAKSYAAEHEDLVISEFVIEKATGACVVVKKGNTELLEKVNEIVAKVVEESSFSKWLDEAAQQASE